MSDYRDEVSVSANARRQAAFSEKMRAAGRKRVHFWVTDEESRIIRELLDRRQAALQLETELGVQLVPGSIYAEPTALGDFTIHLVSAQMASRMVRLWHSVLPYIHPANIQRNRHYACYAMVFSGFAFAVAVYSSPVNRHLDDGATMELRRLAISKPCPRNTATWFMAACERLLRNRFPEVNLLVSYQDTEKHLGTIYRAGGWVKAAGVRYTPWKRSRADRAPSQTKASKVRWEKVIRAHRGGRSRYER